MTAVAWYLVICVAYNHCTTVPSDYPSNALCEEAVKVVSEKKAFGSGAWAMCVPVYR